MKVGETCRALVGVVVLGATVGCAPTTLGGPPLALAPDVIAAARVDTIVMSSDWLTSEPDFSDTFVEELREELAQCAVGPRRLTLRVHVDDLRRGDRLEAVLAGGAEHQVSGLAEFVDPQNGVVLGRYPIRVTAGTNSRVAAALADRQMVVSEAFGRELCRQAFGRNPRGHPLTRATGG